MPRLDGRRLVRREGSARRLPPAGDACRDLRVQGTAQGGVQVTRVAKHKQEGRQAPRSSTSAGGACTCRRRSDDDRGQRAVDDAADGRSPVLACRLRAERDRPRRSGSASRSPTPSTGMLTTPGQPFVGTAGDERRRSRSIRYGDDTDLVLSWVDADDPHAQPARRAHDVLLAPPLRELAHGRARRRSCWRTQNALFRSLRRPREQARGRLQEPGLGRLDRPLDAPLPDRRVERRRGTRTRTTRAS